MDQSKKGTGWHFGLKAHIGVDSASRLVHTGIGTAGNVSDLTNAHSVLLVDEVGAMGDAADAPAEAATIWAMARSGIDV